MNFWKGKKTEKMEKEWNQKEEDKGEKGELLA